MTSGSKNHRDEAPRAKSPAHVPGRHRHGGSKVPSSRHEAPRSTAYRLARYVWHLTYGCLRIGSVGAIVFGVTAAFYLTLRTSPSTHTIKWLPLWLDPVSTWMDHHGYLQNLPAYALLALPFLILCRSRRSRTVAIGVLAVLAALLEAVQIFIPTRTCDWQDVALSWAGLLVTWAMIEGLHWCAIRIRRFLAVPR